MSQSDLMDGCGVYGEYGPMQGARPKKKRPPAILEDAAATFRERNAVYGDNYLRFGHIFRSLFPGGIVPEVTRDADMDRMQLLIQIVNKVTRYAESMSRGDAGHLDSVHDLIVYAAMLEEATGNG
jgi:hypothetical protein